MGQQLNKNKTIIDLATMTKNESVLLWNYQKREINMITKAATYQDVLYVVAVFSWSFMSRKPSPEILFFNGSESFKKNLSRGGWGGELL